MDIKNALTLLGLKEGSTLSDLNLSFRKLAKRYHPDFNRERESWAHKKMTELNLAYEIALEHFTSPKQHEGEKAEDKKKWSFSRQFNRAKNIVLHAVYLYYQYGLENVHLRKEGVRRIRYGDALRYMRTGIDSLKRVMESVTERSHIEYLKVLIDFSSAFLQNMLNSSYYVPSSVQYESDAYRHYYNGCVLLDQAIKEALFGNLLVPQSSTNYYKKLSVGYEEFMVVISRYSNSSWVADTVLKIYLIEMFTRLIALFKDMQY